MTRVISVRGKDRLRLMSDPGFRYVGRRCAGWMNSPWGNPYKVAAFGPDAMAHYRRAIDYARRWHPNAWQYEKLPMSHLIPSSDFDRFREGMLRIGELRGRTLGCWCGEWEPGRPEIACHAVELAKLADGI